MSRLEPKEATRQSIPTVVPILPQEGIVLFPGMIFPTIVQDKVDIKVIDNVLIGEKYLGVFAQNSSEMTSILDSVYKVGTLATIAKMLKLPQGGYQILLHGQRRIALKQMVQSEPYPKAEITLLSEKDSHSKKIEGLRRHAEMLFQKIMSQVSSSPQEVAVALANLPDRAGPLCDLIAANLPLKVEARQEILEKLNVEERCKKIIHFLNQEVNILQVGENIQKQVQEKMGKQQREFFLREQLKAIQKELGELDEREVELEEIRKRMQENNLPEISVKALEKELDKLARIPTASPEYGVVRNYIDWVIDLPWKEPKEINVDLHQAKIVLDKDHYDLTQVKERILDYLAVRKIHRTARQPILCLAGPPGVGKTSLGRSIAKALDRKFARISLGGIHDEAEIRGHRRTYIGAMPGRILKEIQRVGAKNPVFMLDEIDKVGKDFRGDPASALLEVLDPEQNNSFLDHYLDIPFDLSSVFFITTANTLFTIPPALHDRMEVISISGYTEQEKKSILKKFLLPKLLREHGLEKKKIHLTEEAITNLILHYTREAGIRGLERELSKIMRKCARKVAERKRLSKTVRAKDLTTYLGPYIYRRDGAPRKRKQIGVVNGLAWTESGGELLQIEAVAMPGTGKLILTGQLGDVMQESAKAALTYARSHIISIARQLKKSQESILILEDDYFQKHDIHIHVPQGAIPKDGPSAGITIATSLLSLFLAIPVKRSIAMTGEITLLGNVLPIGGVKEKVLAAVRYNIKKVILPEENKRDLDDVPKEIRKKLVLLFASEMDEVAEQVLETTPKGSSKA